MKCILFTLILIAILAIALSACSPVSDVKVGQGDVNACVALYGNNVQGWTFTTLEKMANNVCYLYQQSLSSHAQK